MYTIEQKMKIGEDLAWILKIKKNKDNYYPTTCGNKSAVGLFEMLNCIGEEIKAETIHRVTGTRLNNLA
jgi:hypothetical protein